MPSLVTLGITEYDLVFRFLFTIIRSKLTEVRKFKVEVTHKNTYTSVVHVKKIQGMLRAPLFFKTRKITEAELA